MSTGNKGVRNFFYSVIMVAAALLLCLPLLPSMTIKTSDGHQMLWIQTGNPTGFTVDYTHSANKGRVTESYHCLAGGGFTLATATFESYGAGMLDTLPDGVTMEDMGDHKKLTFPENPVQGLTMIPGQIAKQKLYCGLSEISLAELSPYKRITIRQQNLSLLQALRYYRLHT